VRPLALGHLKRLPLFLPFPRPEPFLHRPVGPPACAGALPFPRRALAWRLGALRSGSRGTTCTRLGSPRRSARPVSDDSGCLWGVLLIYLEAAFKDSTIQAPPTGAW